MSADERLPTEVTDAEFDEMEGKDEWLNQQPAEKQEKDPRGLVSVHSIFPTIQGEGPFVGHSAVFIRLAGCNLQCPQCDTDYTSARHLVNPPQVVQEIQQVAGQRSLVVITGGEPFRQDIKALVKFLINAGLTVQIETNGTLFVPGLPYKHQRLVICCSPKTPKIDPNLRPHITYYKYVLTAGKVDEQDGLPTEVLGMTCKPARPMIPDVDIYIQPADEKDDEKNCENVRVCLDSVFKHGYILSLQIHKIVGLD